MEAIIIKTYSRSLISGEQGVEFELVTNPHKDGQILTRAEAMEYVKEHGLVKVESGEDGAIWDTPERDFQRKWKGCFIQEKRGRKSRKKAFGEVAPPHITKLTDNMEEITTKFCQKCGRELPRTAFGDNARNKDGKMPMCKDCHRAIAKRGGRGRKKMDESVPSESTQQKPTPAEVVSDFANCKTEEDYATTALEFAIGKDAFKEWKAINELHDTLVRYYSR